MTEDRQFERLLQQAATRGRAGGECPDPERLAAYADGSLPPIERVDIERHAADCTRCTEHLALLANLETTPASAATGGTLGRWAWLVPVATAALVFAVWTRTNAPAPMPPAPTDVVEQEKVDRSFADQEGGRADEAFGKRDRAGEYQVESGESDATLPALVPPAERQSASSPQARQSNDEPDRRDVLPRTSATAPSRPRAEERREQATSELLAPRESAAESAFALSDRDTQAKALSTVDAGDGTQIRVSPMRIERTTDGGGSWTTEFGDPAVNLSTVVCAGGDSCWAGGDGGLVLLRQPNGTWIRRPLPAASPVTTIEEVSARRATVTLADGRRYRTDDGGSSWTLLGN